MIFKLTFKLKVIISDAGRNQFFSWWDKSWKQPLKYFWKQQFQELSDKLTDLNHFPVERQPKPNIHTATLWTVNLGRVSTKLGNV